LGFVNQDNEFLVEQRTLAAATFSTASCEGANDLMKKRKSKE
jgi:hypothetical protein